MRRPVSKAFVILSLFALILLGFSGYRGGADQPDFPDIYIDAGCAGTHVGSQANPYDDLSDVNWTTGGDNSIFDYLAGSPAASPTIHLNKGDEWREQMTVGCSGTATYPIVITSYGSGAKPIINGSTLVTGWTLDSGNIWKATVDWTTTLVFMDDERGTKETEKVGLDALKKWYLDDANDLLYIYSTSDPDTAYTNPGIEASKYSYAINIAESYITVDELYAEKSLFDVIIVSGGVSNIIIQNCDVYHSRNSSIFCKEVNTLTIDNCRVAEWGGITLYGSTDNKICNTIVKNCIVENVGTDIDGIMVHYDGGASKEAGDNHLIKDNLIQGGENGEGAIDAQSGTNIVVEGNTCKDYPNHAGISMRGTGKVIARRNLIHDCGYGIYVVPGNVVGHEAYYNLVYAVANYGIMVQGGTGHKFYNNTMSILAGGRGIKIEVNDCIIKNNNVVTIDRGALQTLTTVTSMTSDYNCWLRTDNGDVVYSGLSGILNGYNATEVNNGTLYSNEGFGQHSMAYDAIFVDSANDNFMLNPHSPCIDKGTAVGLTRDYVGQPVGQALRASIFEAILRPIISPINFPDIGAYERWDH